MKLEGNCSDERWLAELKIFVLLVLMKLMMILLKLMKHWMEQQLPGRRSIVWVQLQTSESNVTNSRGQATWYLGGSASTRNLITNIL